MSRSQGWGPTPSEVLHIRLLDWIYEQTAGDASGIPGLRDFADDGEVPLDFVDRSTLALEGQGLVRLGPARLSGHRTVFITEAGRRAVEERDRRRKDPAVRRRACRDAFLSWLARQVDPRPYSDTVPVANFLDADESIYEGERFSVADLEAATEYLYSKGLIDGTQVAELRGVFDARLLPSGMDCIDNHEGSVSDCIARSHASGTSFTTHFNAPVTGQVGIGEHVQQAQHKGIDGATLERLLADVREAAVSIDPDEAAYLLTYLDTVRAEAVADQPDPALIQGSSNRLKQISAKVGNPALSASVSTLTTALLSAFGVG